MFDESGKAIQYIQNEPKAREELYNKFNGDSEEETAPEEKDIQQVVDEPVQDNTREEIAGLKAQLEQQQKMFQEFFQNMKQQPENKQEPEPEPEPEPEVDVDNIFEIVKELKRELRAYKNENETLKKSVETQTDTYQKDKSEKVRKDLYDTIDTVDEELSQEGFYGFKEMGQKFLTDDIRRLHAQGKEDEAQKLFRNPEEWVKYYKDNYPRFKKIFIREEEDTQARTHQEQKQILKKQGQLVSNAGSAPTEDKDEDPVNDFSAYLKNRGKR